MTVDKEINDPYLVSQQMLTSIVDCKGKINAQHSLITGASSGIGWDLAKYHASKGGNLIMTARL